MRNTRVAASLATWFAIVCIASAQDSRLAVFEAYNRARTYADIKPLVSAVLAQQYNALASGDATRLEQVLAQQQLASYHARIVEISPTISFLVLEDVQPKLGRDRNAQAYLVEKSNNSWTLANRMMPDSIIKSLWTGRFSASDFTQPATCGRGGELLSTRSVLAIRRDRSIEISLYPFEFTDADLDYWRDVSGLPDAGPTAGSHFAGRVPARCRAIVTLNDAGEASLLNVGIDDATGALSRSSLWQPSKADVTRLVYRNDVIELTTSGTLGADPDRFRWRVSIKIPVWQQGL